MRALAAQPGGARVSTTNPVESLLQLSAGYYVSRSLHAVADLGVADALGNTPQPVTALAAATAANAGALGRVLRLLALYGIFECTNGTVAHTPASRMLREDHPQSMRSLVRMFGLSGFWAAVGELVSTVKTGEPSADRALPGGIWGYLMQNPEASRVFGEAMTAKAQGHIAGIVRAYDFSGFDVIADIGGGRGHLIQAILAVAPAASGVLFDQPHVVKEATGIATDRLRLVGGDFFNDSIPVADCYILMEVIHDWDDDASRKILRAIRQAARAGAKLLLIEALLPGVSVPNWPTTLDIVMLTIGGRQRTLEEYSALLRDSGFAMTRDIDTHSGIAVIEATAM
jgi:O-methyltransferase domain